MTTDVDKLVKDKTEKGKFNFALAVVDRDYPEIVVPVYLNERKTQELVSVTEELINLDGKTHKEAVEKAIQLQEQHDKIVAELKASEYRVLIRGISPEENEALDAHTYEVYPREYEESVHPLSGQTIRTEKPDERREELYVTLLRQAHIVSVTAPTGEVDDDFKGEENLEKVRLTWARLPYVARVKLDEAITTSKVSVDFYRELVDEVF